MRADEIEYQNFLNLDIGLPVGQLRASMRQVLAGNEPDPVELDAHNRRGQPIRCRVSFAPLSNHRDDAVEGVILVIISERQVSK
jgi:two-component system CheB/CheR fusion protein